MGSSTQASVDSGVSTKAKDLGFWMEGKLKVVVGIQSDVISPVKQDDVCLDQRMMARKLLGSCVQKQGQTLEIECQLNGLLNCMDLCGEPAHDEARHHQALAAMLDSPDERPRDFAWKIGQYLRGRGGFSGRCP